MSEHPIAIIGGTGLYDLEGLTERESISCDTPFGKPSSEIVKAKLSGRSVLFLARHGVGHRLLPSEINYRANIFALKSLGAVWCVSVAAVGSLREEICPGDVVVPDQLFDRTKNRESTFFGRGLVAHVSFGRPFCTVLRNELVGAAQRAKGSRPYTVHPAGTYVCMEGPAFSTRAESLWYRSLQASVIGMTALTEAKLCREAEIAYATLAFSTDYDCWKETEEVNISEILATLGRNTSLAKEILTQLIPALSTKEPSIEASRALDHALVTRLEDVPTSVKEDLRPLLNRFLP